MGVEGYGRLATGSRVGVYQVRSFLGRGATASVYECVHSTLGRVVAVKLLHPHLACNAIALKRFLREGRALSRIVHSNVVEVLDVGEHEGGGFLVMSLAVGEDLSEHLRRHQPMGVVEIANVMLPVIGAVAAAHDAGVIHRDLKPSNIRMTRDGRGEYVPKVLDFGISKLVTDDLGGDLTESESVLGTTHYMAPEQLRSARRVDARSDVYSLGVILYECAAGRRPFEGDNTYERMHAILTAPVPPLRRWRADLPPAFEALVQRAMQRKAPDRFATARDLGLALAPFASEPERWRNELRWGAAHAVPTDDPVASALTESSFTLSTQTPHPRSIGWARRAGPVAAIAAGAFLFTAAVASRAPSPTVPSYETETAEGSAVAPAAGSATPESAGLPARSEPSAAASSASASKHVPRKASNRTKVVTPPPGPSEQMGPNDAPILE